MEPSFEKLLGLLAESRVQFVVVGGVAVTLHGYVRLTDDIDLLVSAEASKEGQMAVLSERITPARYSISISTVVLIYR